MAFVREYDEPGPSREEIDAGQGPVLLEFGTSWCGVCRRTQPLIEEALAAHPGVKHVKVGDGPGRRLGRSFRVKLWPTLVFLKDGEAVATLVRPDTAGAIAGALAQIDPA